MKTIFTFLASVAFACLISSLLLSCDKWELPTRKTQRNCVKPAGTLTAQTQERKVDFSITNNTGTVDKVIWDFGNGSTTATTGLAISYTYPTSGTFTAKATLSNSCLQETTLLLPIAVSDAVVPTVSLQPATELSINSATLGMTITSMGNAPVSKYGVCYSSTNTTPTTGDMTSEKTVSVLINSPISFGLTNLQPNTTYYVRSYAVNKAGTGYSSPAQSFRTGSKPSVIIAGTPVVGVTTGSVGFVVLNAGNPAAVEYGICYSSNNTTPDVTNSTLISVATPTVSANTTVNISNLSPNTKYYYRAYAKLPSGEVVYSEINSFSTQIDTLALDLIASVSFTDGSLLDISGNNNHAIRVDNPTFTADRKGKANSAIQLDGLNDYFYMSDNSTLRPDAFSISIWIKPVTVDRWMQIYNKSNFNTGANESYSALIRPTIGAAGTTLNTDIKQNSNCQSGAWQTLSFASGIELNKWYHVVFSYSGRSARMYVNGQLLYKREDLPASVIDKCPGGELKFGAQGQIQPNYFYGAMDDIRMYRRVLTDSEVLTLYNQ